MAISVRSAKVGLPSTKRRSTEIGSDANASVAPHPVIPFGSLFQRDSEPLLAHERRGAFCVPGVCRFRGGPMAWGSVRTGCAALPHGAVPGGLCGLSGLG